MTLYEIERQIEEAIDKLFSAVDEETGEVDEAALHALDELKAERAVKMDNIGAYIKNLEAEVVALKEESKTLAKRADTKARKIESLKEYVANNMLSRSETKFESTRVVFSFRKSEKVVIRDENAIPKKYLVKKVEFVPEKNAIKAAIKAGNKVRGAELVENQNLQVK